MSVRARLLLTALLTLAVGLGALVVAGNALLDRRVETEATALLRERADAELAALDLRGGHVRVREVPNDARLDRQAWVLEGDRVVERPRGAPPELDALAVQLGRRGVAAEAEDSNDVRVRAQPVVQGGRRLGVVVVAYDVNSLETLQKEVLIASLIIAGLVMLAGALVIRSALLGALRPVAQMTESAQAWSEHDLGHRFGLGPANDELTGLAATLDELLERIAASRRHEQRFAGDVAHELRTPLAGLRARAELALTAAGPDADGERIEALRGVVRQSERLDRTIDALLALARQELDPAAGSVDVAALARELAEPHATPRVEVRAPGRPTVVAGDAEVVRRALAPLVDNARRHARSRVELDVRTVDGRAEVVVRDDGPGLDLRLGDSAFDPGQRASPDAGGAGLGLPLARRLARSCGGDVTAGDQRDGGCFVLALPLLGRT